MQLSLIREDFPNPENFDGKSSLWINTKDRGIYFGPNRVFLNYDDPDSPATIGDLDRELGRKNYFAIETKFIDSDGDLILNTCKNNATYDKMTKRIKYTISEIVDYNGKTMGIPLRNYRRIDTEYMNSDTSLLCIDLLGDVNGEKKSCIIVFPEDKVSSVSLVELSKKFVIPDLMCFLSDLVVNYRLEGEEYYTSLVLYNDLTNQSLSNPLLFKFEQNLNENKCRKVYNSELSETPLSLGFVLDLTNDGLLSLYYYPFLGDQSSTITNIYDYYIKSCSVKFYFSHEIEF